jgi:hypothetical protein
MEKDDAVSTVDYSMSARFGVDLRHGEQRAELSFGAGLREEENLLAVVSFCSYK